MKGKAMFSVKKKVSLLAITCLIIGSSISADTSCLFVEGPTGVGKTTFVALLSKELTNAATIYEPVDTFTNVNGTGNILDLFFKDPKRWTFTTECYIALMHAKAVENQAKNSSASVMIVDRSLYADCYAFGKMALRAGNMQPIEWEIYKQIIEVIAKNTTTKPCGFIYLLADPQDSIDRVHVRNRAGEEEVELQFIKNLDSCYREWFIEKKDIPADLANVPVLIIDAKQNFRDDPIIQQKCVNQVKEFIAKCKK